MMDRQAGMEGEWEGWRESGRDGRTKGRVGGEVLVSEGGVSVLLVG